MGASKAFFSRPRRLARALLDASWGRSCAKPGAKSETKGPGIDFGSHFGSQNDVCCEMLGVSAACVFFCVVGLDYSKVFFLFPWFAPCARKGRTSRSHRKNQWISSMFQLPPSRRRAPRQAENQRHHVQKHQQQTLEKASNFILFWSPGALPETKPQKCSPAGSPGGSGALLARLLEAEIDQLSAPRGPQEAPHEFSGPPGRPRAAAKSDLRRSRRPPWAHMAPRSSQDPFGPSFWTLRPPLP